MRNSIDQTLVVSCKSGKRDRSEETDYTDEQNKLFRDEKHGNRSRELVRKKWDDGLITKIESLTGYPQFTYVTAVTKLKGDAGVWQVSLPFRNNLRGNPIKILTLQEMLSDFYDKTDTTVASSEVGRLLQVIKASGWKP